MTPSTLTLYTKPVPINQKYFVKNGRNILSSKYRNAKEELMQEATALWHEQPLTRNIAVNIIFTFGDKRKRDIDANIKILLDSLEGIVYENDNQITELHVYKEYKKGVFKTLVQVL